MANTERNRTVDARRAKEPRPAVKPRQQRVKSMHEAVPVWYDCCSCQAEPYWAELDEEAGNSDGRG